MSTPRKKLLETNDPLLKELLDEMIGNLLSVNKGYFSHRFEIGKSDLLVEFKFDEISNINFTPKTTVREIAKTCDCLQIIDLSKGSVELFEWSYDADHEFG